MNMSSILASLALVSRRHARVVVTGWIAALLVPIIIWQAGGVTLTPKIWLLDDAGTSTDGQAISSQLDPALSRMHVVCSGTTPLPVVLGDDSVVSGTGSIDVAIASIERCYEERWLLSDEQDQQKDSTIIPFRQSGGRFKVSPEIRVSIVAHQFDRNVAQDIRKIVVEDVWHAERAGLPVAFVILFLLTGSLTAAAMPLLIASVSVIASAGLLLLVDRPMSIYAMNVTVMIGMAVGLDYTLLCLQRYREERRLGTESAKAAQRLFATAGHTVVISGCIVVVSLAGMLFVPINVFRDVSIGAIAVVCVSVVSILTLLPGFLAWSDGASEPLTERQVVLRIMPGFRQRLWGSVSYAVTRFSWPCMLLVVIALSPLVWQSFAMQGRVSIPQVSLAGVSDDGAVAGYVEQEINSTLLSVVDITISSEESTRVTSAMNALLMELGHNIDFAPVVIVQENPSGTMVVVRTLVVYPADSPEAMATLSHLKNVVVPAAFEGISATSMVSGPLLVHHDVMATISFWQGRIVAATVAISALLLALVFRSLVVSLLAVGTTCLSVTAAIGVVVLVVQRGYGADLLGLTAAPAIEQWVPIVVFCIVFGLSMDYHVFMVSRIREQFLLEGDLRASIQTGLSTTGGVISGAAVIMAVVFAGLISGRIPMLQQVGLGLTAAVLIDAFLVRLILVPACMSLLGKRKWLSAHLTET